MRTNLENCLRNTLRHDLWLAAELTSNLRELRDRARDGGAMAALHEFFNLYRFDDNEQADDGFWTDPRPQAAEPEKATEPSPYSQEDIKALAAEKNRRIYYQNIAYHAASVLDQIEHRDVTKGEALLVGTADEPNDEVVLALDRLLHRIREAEAPHDPVRQEGPTYDELKDAVVDAFSRLAVVRDCRFEPKMTAEHRWPCERAVDCRELEDAYNDLQPLWKHLRSKTND